MLVGLACAVIRPAMPVCFMLRLLGVTPARMIVGIALAIDGVVLWPNPERGRVRQDNRVAEAQRVK
jgi:hypothetical protein